MKMEIPCPLTKVSLEFTCDWLHGLALRARVLRRFVFQLFRKKPYVTWAGVRLSPHEAEDGGRKLRQDVRLQMLDPKQILPNLRLLSLFRPRQLSKVIHFFYFFYNPQFELHLLEGPD